MSKFIAEKITMGFAYPKPQSEYFGYFETEQKAIEWAKNKFSDYRYTIQEEETFFQKDLGTKVIEVYFQDVEDEDFIGNIELCKMLNEPYFTEDKMTRV